MKKTLLTALFATIAGTIAAMPPQHIETMTDVVSAEESSAIFHFDDEGRLCRLEHPTTSVTIDYSLMDDGEITLTYEDEYGKGHTATLFTLGEIDAEAFDVETL